MNICCTYAFNELYVLPKVTIKNHDDGLGLSISRSGIANTFEVRIELESFGFSHVKNPRSKLFSTIF